MSKTIAYACHVPDCPGGEACRRKAGIRVMRLLYRGLFGADIQFPSMSRWWKFTPLARQSLM
eukprot:7615952-Lingulodinium_polyedra.AAC.1